MRWSHSSQTSVPSINQVIFNNGFISLEYFQGTEDSPFTCTNMFYRLLHVLLRTSRPNSCSIFLVRFIMHERVADFEPTSISSKIRSRRCSKYGVFSVRESTEIPGSWITKRSTISQGSGNCIEYSNDCFWDFIRRFMRDQFAKAYKNEVTTWCASCRNEIRDYVMKK